jgi:hypothetical protein
MDRGQRLPPADDAQAAPAAAATDPAAPNPVPSAGSETVYSLSQWRCYLDPTADASQARQYLGTKAFPGVVDGSEMARRVVVAGYTSTMSRQRVLWLASHDPEFPETLTAGEQNQEQLFSWNEAEPDWRARVYPPPGWGDLASPPAEDPTGPRDARPGPSECH